MQDIYMGDHGKGFPLILVHGFLGSLDNWITIAKKISDLGFEVHIVDQ